MTEPKPYTKFAQGIFIVKSKNSAFNSDFSGLPRRLPDENGTIYATDKALKYCIRKYLLDKGELVFVWRRYGESGDPISLEENYKKFIELLKEKEEIDKNYKVDDKEKNSAIITNLLKAIDIKLFGVTFAKKSKKKEEQRNLSITGPVQLSYGVNKLNENTFYNNDILSPYITEEEKKQSTIGNETKTLEAHYVYDFVINPNNLIDDLEFLDKEEREKLILTEDDVDKFKEAICKGVNYVNSTTKIGSEGELLLFVELKTEEDKESKKLEGTFLPLLKDLVKIEEENNRTKIDLTEVFNVLNGYSDQVEKIEIYYNPSLSEILGVPEDEGGLNIEKFDIITLEKIDENQTSA